MGCGSPSKPANKVPPKKNPPVKPVLPCPIKCNQQLNEQNSAKAKKSASTLVKQQRKDTCALMSTRSVLQEFKGRAPDENGMVPIGVSSGAYSVCNGTTDESRVMTQAGMPSDEYFRPTLLQIAKWLDDGKGVVLAYDTKWVWARKYPGYAKNPNVLGHAVRVIGTQRNVDTGAVTSITIVDSGDGTIDTVDSATVIKAMNGFGGGRCGVTRSRINSTATCK